jgi:Cyclin, N-terminal domain
MRNERCRSDLSIDAIQDIATVQKQRHDKDHDGFSIPSTALSRNYHGPYSLHRAQIQIPKPHFTFWRQQMFDWSCLVVDRYSIHREVVTLSFHLLDRYLTNEILFGMAHNDVTQYQLNGAVIAPPPPPISRDDYQLYSMTCLYIAMKLLIGSMSTTSTGCAKDNKLSVQTFVDMSKQYYSKDVILCTERNVLQSLDWYLNAPTTTCYVRLLLQLFPSETAHQMERTAFYFTDLAIVHSYFCTKKSIDIALASIYHATRLHTVSEQYMQIYRHVMHPVLVYKRDCPEFRQIYLHLAKIHGC